MLWKKKYLYICAKGHQWIREGYGGLFNWSICPKCKRPGVVKHCYGKV